MWGRTEGKGQEKRWEMAWKGKNEGRIQRRRKKRKKAERGGRRQRWNGGCGDCTLCRETEKQEIKSLGG